MLKQPQSFGRLLISPPSVFSKVEQGRYLNHVTLRHNVLPLPGKITKKQHHHRQINKHIKQDWGDGNSGKSAAQSGSFVGIKTDKRYSPAAPFFTNKNNETGIKWLDFQFQHLRQSELSSKMFGCWQKTRPDVKCLKEKMETLLIIPSEMPCEWTLCLTLLSLSLSAGLHLFIFYLCRKKNYPQTSR